MDDKEKEINLTEKKLEIEIAKLNLPWYKKFEFWKILIPTIAVIFSLFFTFGRGIMDSQKERLAIQKEQLKLEILQFEIKKGTVVKDIDILQTELNIKESLLDSLNNSIDSLNNSILSFKKTNQYYKQQIFKSKEEKNYLEKERGLDKKFYSDKLFEQYDLEKKRANQIHNYKEKISYLRTKLSIEEVKNNFYSEKFKLTPLDSSNLNIRIFKIESNRYLEINNEWKESLKQIDENYKKAIKKIDSLGIDYSVREIELWLMQKEKERKKEKND